VLNNIFYLDTLNQHEAYFQTLAYTARPLMWG